MSSENHHRDVPVTHLLAESQLALRSAGYDDPPETPDDPERPHRIRRHTKVVFAEIMALPEIDRRTGSERRADERRAAARRALPERRSGERGDRRTEDRRATERRNTGERRGSFLST